ncbi:hypothetical protein [Gilliamella mensalis]|uniref:hypothetical protein n=1 Tax=Gilliamella mensalis TaxID=1908520 RepID=UPI000A1582D6|nr:hypothetical protein [Gilliamella mensalis]
MAIYRDDSDLVFLKQCSNILGTLWNYYILFICLAVGITRVVYSIFSSYYKESNHFLHFKHKSTLPKFAILAFIAFIL